MKDKLIEKLKELNEHYEWNIIHGVNGDIWHRELRKLKSEIAALEAELKKQKEKVTGEYSRDRGTYLQRVADIAGLTSITEREKIIIYSCYTLLQLEPEEQINSPLTEEDILNKFDLWVKDNKAGYHYKDSEDPCKVVGEWRPIVRPLPDKGKTAGIDNFSKRLDDIFEQGMPTKAQILDAYNKYVSQSPGSLPSDEEIQKWAAGKVNEIDPDEFGYGDLLIIGAKYVRDWYKDKLNKK